MSGIIVVCTSRLESYNSLVLLQQYFLHMVALVLFSNLEYQVAFFVKEF